MEKITRDYISKLEKTGLKIADSITKDIQQSDKEKESYIKKLQMIESVILPRKD